MLHLVQVYLRHNLKFPFITFIRRSAFIECLEFIFVEPLVD